MGRAGVIVQLARSGQPHALAGQEIGLLLGRERFDVASLLTGVAPKNLGLGPGLERGREGNQDGGRTSRRRMVSLRFAGSVARIGAANRREKPAVVGTRHG